MLADPYLRDDSQVIAPPATLWGKLRYLGPGFVLSAAIVGSGELIATTTLGAKAGYATLWVILLSCFVKVAIQLEFGRHTIQTGETVMQSFDRLPGPRMAGTSWTLWTWLLLHIPKTLQVGGIVGLVAVVLNMCFPALAVPAWTWIMALVAAIMISLGRYAFIEGVSLALIGVFSLLTMAAVVALQWTPYAFELSDVVSGLKFSLPAGTLLYAIGAFGITGVGGDEIMYYNYWLIEKGYAAYVGNPPAADAEEEVDSSWSQRARGWINIMYLDALLSMLVYTVMTAAFYILGASVLHPQFVASGSASIPENKELVASLAEMYTETLGDWAGWLFLFSAFVVLFSTLFCALASWTRIFADAFGVFGWMDNSNLATRRTAVFWLAWFFPIAWALAYLFFKAPGFMVIVGGASTSILLLVVLFAAMNFRYRRCERALRPGLLYQAAFNLSGIAILLLAAVSVYRSIAG